MSRRPPFPERIEHAVVDWRDGTPVSPAFGDVYFSVDGGIAETTHVFIDGNQLRLRFAAGGFRHFTIGETGFGTGLNFLVAARTFLALAPDDAILHFVSVEKYPLAPDDLARAHAHWPELAELAGELRAAMPPAVAGFHRRTLAGGRVRLTLLLGDAAALLPRLHASVDAWFLDGFSPVRNEDLWTPSLFADVARLSAADATLATFTAVGNVRRGLADCGFRMTKVPGFGRKWDMLRGRRDECRPQDAGGARRAAVVGGGLAGCAAARALAERGWQVDLFERKASLADETSGNLAGAVYPKFSLHETPQNRWYRDSYLFALHRLPQVMGAPDGVRWDRCGLLQLANGDEDALRAVAGTGRWPADVLHWVDGGEAARIAGVATPGGGLWFPGAAWVNPPALCAALADHPGIRIHLRTAVTALQHDGHLPRLAWQPASDTAVEDEQAHAGSPGTPDGDTATARDFDTVVIANALAANTFVPTRSLPLRRVRGQVSHVAATGASRALRTVLCHEGYVTPARLDLHCVGATFAPRDADAAVRDNDHAENLHNLAQACPALHDALGGARVTVTGGRTGFRTQTPDYLPLVGAVADEAAWAQEPAARTPGRLPGVWILAALGAKGIAFSLLGAEMIAAGVNNEPAPVDDELLAALDPCRFLVRARRKGKAGTTHAGPVAEKD